MNTAEILRTGFSGLIFLLAGFAFRLLRAEQSRAGRRDEKMLAAIRSFLVYTLVFATLGAGFSLGEVLVRRSGKIGRNQEQIRACRKGADRLDTTLKQASATSDELRSAAMGYTTQCLPLLEKLDED